MQGGGGGFWCISRRCRFGYLQAQRRSGQPPAAPPLGTRCMCPKRSTPGRLTLVLVCGQAGARVRAAAARQPLAGASGKTVAVAADPHARRRRRAQRGQRRRGRRWAAAACGVAVGRGGCWACGGCRGMLESAPAAPRQTERRAARGHAAPTAGASPVYQHRLQTRQLGHRRHRVLRGGEAAGSRRSKPSGRAGQQQARMQQPGSKAGGRAGRGPQPPRRPDSNRPCIRQLAAPAAARPTAAARARCPPGSS